MCWLANGNTSCTKNLDSSELNDDWGIMRYNLKHIRPIWLIIFGIFVLLNLLIAVSYRRYSKNAEAIEHLYQYGHQFQMLPKQIAGLSEVAEKDWKVLLVAIINQQNPSPRLQYLEALHQKLRGQGLRIVGVQAGISANGEDPRRRFSLSFPIVMDSDSRIQSEFHMYGSHSHSHDGLFILTSELQVRFSSFQIPKEDHLRMLVEKYLLGSIDYSYHGSPLRELFSRGKRAPLLTVRALTSNKVTRLKMDEIKGKKIVLLLSDCATCQVEGYIKQLGKLQQTENEGKDIIALCSSDFSSVNLQSIAEKYHVGIPIYIIQDEAGEPNSEYITRYRLNIKGPIVATCNEQGIVSSLSPLFRDHE
jgi:peroxiredoxin